MAAGTRVNVSVTATEDPSKDQGIAWAIDYDVHPSGNGQKKGERDVEVKRVAGGAEFIFTLDDRTRFDLSFKGSGADAIFVAQSSACPKSQGNGGGEFVIDANTSKRKASMIDLTTRDGDFAYSLNFDSNAGEKNCDPVILNRP